MKLAAILLLSIISISSASAQLKDEVLIRVRYTHTDKIDISKNNKARTENMILFVGKNASLYSSYDKIKHEISDEQKFLASIKNRGSNGQPTAFIIDDTNSRWMTTATYLFFAKENKFFTKEVMALQAYLVEENAPKINWKISLDTLSFSGIKCQKATATFEGKNWTAWFAPSMPFQSGPWKLNGLPGLIIEAYDEQAQVKFEFAGIEKAAEIDNVRLTDNTKGPNAHPNTFNAIDQLIGRDVGNAYFEDIIRLPIGAVKVSKAQLTRLQDAFKKDPEGFVKARSRY